MKQGLSDYRSVHPSICPQVFQGLAHQFFLKHSMVLGAHIQQCVTARSFGKNPHQAKMTKNGQKWPKNMVFGLFRKITSLVQSGICVKERSYGSSTYCENFMFSSYSQKWLSANEISVFFNHQYFTNRLISDFDFGHE